MNYCIIKVAAAAAIHLSVPAHHTADAAVAAPAPTLLRSAGYAPIYLSGPPTLGSSQVERWRPR